MEWNQLFFFKGLIFVLLSVPSIYPSISRQKAMPVVLLTLAIVVLFAPKASAQAPTRRYPAEQYYVGLAALREGSLGDAVDLFESSVRSGRTTVEGKWVDSIPGLVMLAECHYQLGNLAEAHQNFDAAMKLDGD